MLDSDMLHMWIKIETGYRKLSKVLWEYCPTSTSTLYVLYLYRCLTLDRFRLILYLISMLLHHLNSLLYSFTNWRKKKINILYRFN